MTTKLDSRQIKKRQALPKLGTAADTIVETILDKINTEVDFPLRIAASVVPDAILNFSSSSISAADGANKVVAPISNQIFGNLVSPTINFQTQALSNAADFDITWGTSTLGQFRFCAFTLIASGKIKVLFSAEYASEAALIAAVNPGTLYVTGGLPIGHVTLQSTNASPAAYKTAGSATDIIENAKIFRFGSGAGGGGGTGDANAFTENLKFRLLSSFYEFVTPNVFSVDQETLIDNATAGFNIADATYDFDITEFIESINMFCPEFLASEDDSRRVELHAEWFDEASLDSNATYQASLNGGTTYEAITMTRQGQSFKFTGDKELALPANVLLYSQATETQTTELDATSLRGLAKKVTVANKSSLSEIELKIVKTGSPDGSYIISIIEDNSNAPTGEILYSKIALNSTLSAGTNIITINDFRKVVPAGDYWIVIETDATYQASFSTGVTSIGLRTTAGSDQVYNGSAWVAGSASLFFELSGFEYDLRVKITASASGKKLKAYGLFYDENVGSVVTGFQALQKFRFDGDDDIFSFTVTNFLPNADHLKIYDITSGQVYRYGAWALNGKTVTFPAGTFLVPGEEVVLIFDQSEGTGFDYSDANNNLLASNHLGSTDATLDKSIAGRGILIRNSNGELKELWLDASNNLNITDPL